MSRKNYCGPPRGVYHCPSCRGYMRVVGENAQLRAQLAQARTIVGEYRRHHKYSDNQALKELCSEIAFFLADLPDAPKNGKP